MPRMDICDACQHRMRAAVSLCPGHIPRPVMHAAKVSITARVFSLTVAFCAPRMERSAKERETGVRVGGNPTARETRGGEAGHI